MYRRNHHAYCGMSGIADTFDDRAEARKAAADRVRAYRQSGYAVTTIARGAEWEILEPEDSIMVPDDCGSLVLKHITFECRECGSKCETRDEAAEHCTNDLFDWQVDSDDDDDANDTEAE